MSNVLLPEYRIVAAENGGFLVTQYSDYRDRTWPLFAGTLSETLSYVERSITEDVTRMAADKRAKVAQ